MFSLASFENIIVIISAIIVVVLPVVGITVNSAVSYVKNAMKKLYIGTSEALAG